MFVRFGSEADVNTTGWAAPRPTGFRTLIPANPKQGGVDRFQNGAHVLYRDLTLRKT